MTFEPAPLTQPPQALMKSCKSTISGSLAGFKILVSPLAARASIMIFSVAPTLEKESIISHDFKLSPFA